jgi:D-arabinose 1-dehydrogenase-like Zn-dependent alcohol dehydrogenase
MLLQDVVVQSWQIIEFGAPLEARTQPVPSPQGTEVLLRVAACGVCHSDLHVWQGFFDLGGGRRQSFAGGIRLPFTMGHEIVGTIVAVGPDADIAVGARRVVFPWLGCGTCDMCRSDREHLCLDKQSIGTRRPGGFSDHVLVRHPRYLIDFGDIPEALACTYACSGLTAYGALKKIGPLTSDDWILVIGVGGVGLAAVSMAQSLTPARIVVADIDPTKREAAVAAGAGAVIDNGAGDAIAALKRSTGGGVWAAIDFVGRPETAQFGLDVLRRSGTLILVGLHGGALNLPLATVPPRLLTIRGSQVGTLAEMHELMALARAGRVPPIPVRTLPMSSANEALAELRAGTVVGRLVLTP